MGFFLEERYYIIYTWFNKARGNDTMLFRLGISPDPFVVIELVTFCWSEKQRNNRRCSQEVKASWAH